jgi:hypothetical protein
LHSQCESRNVSTSPVALSAPATYKSGSTRLV